VIAEDTGAQLNGVSCTSATFCVAVYPGNFVDVLS